ncbi:tetraspanin-1 [Periophthalmus magnuspinnatus]|uniref:tetraspanin-1 n=1 Tax=Periophthalmus magnuspinnatus TaxID=409849 RepID=UPI00145B6C83|nr:tetraspanin-1 [Periophthalmus magnuspinnatus]
MSCFTFVRLMMLLFNTFICLGGVTLLGMGIWVSVDGVWFLQALGPFSGGPQLDVGFFCAAVGAVLVLLGLLGACGAHGHSKSLLLLFFCVVLIIFIAEVAAALVVLFFSSFAERIVLDWTSKTLQEKYGPDLLLTRVWNSTMNQLSCCGFINYTDFEGSKFVAMTRGHFPQSCCWTQSAPCSAEEAQRSKVQGCFRQILQSLTEQANAVGGTAAGVGVLEMAAMVVSMYLYCHLDKMNT